MKSIYQKTVLIAAFCFLTLSSLAQNITRLNNSEIDHIRVYQTGAYVNRTAKTTLTPGINEIVLDELSPYINSNSISVKGFGDATIMGVKFQQNYLKDQKKSPEISKLETERDSINIKLRYIQNKIAATNEGIAVLQANKSIGGNNNGVVANDLIAIVDYYVKKINTLKDDLIDLALKEQKTQEQINKINQQLSVLNNKQNQPEGNIIVTVDAKSKSPATFDFSYLINTNVSWTPMYDVRVKNINSPIEFILKAKVFQSTGEDWNDVSLTLNTGNPTDGAEKPSLYPWYLYFQQLYEKDKEERKEYKSAAPAMRMDSDGAVAVGFATSLEWANAQMTENQLSNEYTIQSKYTLKSGNTETQIEINHTNANAFYEYGSAPKINTDAFLLGHIPNWESLNLLDAEGTVYFDGAYVGTCAIQNTTTNDTMHLSLGKDERIAIKRTKLNEFTGSNLFGNMKEKTCTYDILVKNTKKEAITIIVEEQLPISQVKEITVNALELSGGNLNNDTGLLTWKMTLQPGESSTKKLSFTVKYPKDKVVSGL
ncbi:MAG: DUF4139 domain-containing protein [Bacteroidota bacterium]